MGVPHLITYLRPFATSVDLSGYSGVIDGPGLAYHVWHICLSSQEEAQNPFEATPSYKILGETTVRWLDDLQAHCFCLKKIFFDGLLPPSKRSTRIDRIRGYTKQLNGYNQAWPQIIPSSYAEVYSQSPDIKLFSGASSSRLSRLPAPPFLVQAIIEALSHSERYADLIEVVPGEADSYCAGYLKTYGGVVLTGDSDLLLHDLGDGAVCFFKDIDINASAISTSTKCVRYQVGAIAQRLGLEPTHGLLALAFEMTMDSHASFRELLQKALKLSAVQMHGPTYQDFVREYQTPQSIQETYNDRNINHSSSLSVQLKKLDPRVSEYLLQFPPFSQAVGLPIPLPAFAIDQESNSEVFLPFLLDCPLRTSAWEMSTAVRLLAYGLVNLVLPQEESVLKVTEYRRLQNGSRGRELHIPAAQDMLKDCSDLVDLIEKLRNSILAQPVQNLWRALAIYQDQELHLGTVRTALSSTLIGRPNDSKIPSFRLTWDAIHLSAQLQGSYYSFRILKQILSVILLFENKSAPSAVNQLHCDLRFLPVLDDLPSLVDATHNIGNSDDQKILEMVQEYLGARQHPADDAISARKERNRKKRKPDNKSKVSNHAGKSNRRGETGIKEQNYPGESKNPQKKSNNIFELLSTR